MKIVGAVSVIGGGMTYVAPSVFGVKKDVNPPNFDKEAIGTGPDICGIFRKHFSNVDFRDSNFSKNNESHIKIATEVIEELSKLKELEIKNCVSKLKDTRPGVAIIAVLEFLFEDREDTKSVFSNSR